VRIGIGGPGGRARLATCVAELDALYQLSVFPGDRQTRAMQEEVLEFWFAPAGTAEHGTTRSVWFRKDPAFDAQIWARFGVAIETALTGGFTEWSSPRGALARILLLDQFTRNSFRDTPRAFAGDALAFATADDAVARGDDGALAPVERWFMYMPYVHAESLHAQERSLALFGRLRDQTGLAEPFEWAERHAGVIRLFGRFPHRNATLGRASTAEEIAFLAAPGSRF
jgi:uncharacterized protein (DUF924 family)